MYSESARQRLAQLNLDRLPTMAVPPGAARDRPAFTTAALPAPSELPAGEILPTPRGDCYLIRRRLLEVWPAANRHLEVAARLRETGGSAEAGGSAERGSSAERSHEELAQLLVHFPEGVLYLDLETCGFAGSPLFLVGLVRHHETELVLEQLLARDYSEEASVLAALEERLHPTNVLVTFNGKSFDWPMVRDRLVFHRMDGAEASRSRPVPLHCDLLHHARRRWRERLPDCKLQTLERFICRRARQDDLPGSEVPREYHDYVRTGETRGMCSILHHNALDLITLVELSLRVCLGD